MKTYKTSTKLGQNLNYIKNQQSDIFIQKGLNKPEIEYKHKKMVSKNPFESTYNFLEWKDTSPHQNPSIKIKQNPNYVSQILNSNPSKTNDTNYNLKNAAGGPKKHKVFYEEMFEKEPNNNSNKSDLYSNARYQKETMNLGNYEGKEYKIKKNKSQIYDPSPYFEDKNPLKQKMNLIYGGCDDLIGNYKPAINRTKRMQRSSSSIGFARRNFETKNECDPKLVDNPKKMKHFLIYGNKGIENVNKKPAPMNYQSSTNNGYIPGEDCTQNRLNFLKSNIFNDIDIEKKNNNDNDDYNEENRTIRVNLNIKPKKLNRAKSAYNISKGGNIDNISNINENLNNKESHAKRFLYQHNDEKLPNKLNWNDPQLYLLFPQSKNSDVLKQNARERKFNNIYGTSPITKKEKFFEEFKSDDRPEIDQAMKNNNIKNLNYSKMKRISDNISQFQGNQFINEIKKNQEEEKKGNEEFAYDTYEIKLKNNKNNKQFSNYDIEKKFASKGIHIYDIVESNGSILNNKNDSIIAFKIRGKNKDKNFEGKINRIKKEFKDNGLIMNKKINKKKENNDIIPISLKWNDPHCDLLTKNKIAVKTNEDKIHSKYPLDRKNEEEKITRINVNLKYKNKPYNY